METLTETPPPPTALAATPGLDRSEFDQLVSEHGADVLRYLRTVLGPQNADDAYADTMLQAFRSRASFDPQRASNRTWLFAIAITVTRRQRRQQVTWLRDRERARWFAEATAAPASEADRAVDRVGAHAIRGELAAALGALPRRLREVFVLHALADASHAEIAAALDIREGTVKSRLHRARESLRGTLDRLDIAPSHPGAPNA